jgi:hypothetical protein
MRSRHRRGAINFGISYGKGQSAPSWLHNKEYALGSTIPPLLSQKGAQRT